MRVTRNVDIHKVHKRLKCCVEAFRRKFIKMTYYLTDNPTKNINVKMGPSPVERIRRIVGFAAKRIEILKVYEVL